MAASWLVSATIVQAGTDSTRSERSAGTGLKSREATGRPTAADRYMWVTNNKPESKNITASLSFLTTLPFSDVGFWL